MIIIDPKLKDRSSFQLISMEETLTTFTQCPCVCLFLSLFMSVPVPVCLFLSSSPSLFMSVSLILLVSSCPSVSPSLSLFLSVSLSHYICLCLFLADSAYLSHVLQIHQKTLRLTRNPRRRLRPQRVSFRNMQQLLSFCPNKELQAGTTGSHTH